MRGGIDTSIREGFDQTLRFKEGRQNTNERERNRAGKNRHPKGRKAKTKEKKTLFGEKKKRD